MADIAYDDILSSSTELVPMAPPPERLRALREATRWAVREALTWLEVMDGAVQTVADQQEYVLTLPTGSEIVSIDSANIDGGLPLEIMRLVDAEREYRASMITDATTPQVLALSDTDTVKLFPPPNDAYSISIIAYLAPTSDADSVPEKAFLPVRDAIIAYAAAELLKDEGASYGDPARADQLRRQAYFYLSGSRAYASTGQVKTSLRARGPLFN